MKEQIVSRLHEIERREQVRILLAVESGSRAWGFASPDSDYDVRFIYIRPQKDYLRLERVRDVIEEPIAGELDINGWDLQKALRLLHKSNPTLFEWVSSPIVYLETDFADRFRAVMQPHFSSKSALYHYLCTAQGNYREYLRGDRVRAKKYFYVLRPILACRWVLERGTPPPMRFDELAAAELPQALRADVAYLLDLKIHARGQRDSENHGTERLSRSRNAGSTGTRCRPAAAAAAHMAGTQRILLCRAAGISK